MNIELQHHTLQLLTERAVYLPALKTLLVADPHFGKAATFRAQGIPVPSGTTASNLQRLDDLFKSTQAQQLIFLGDFFHARSSQTNATLTALRTWRLKNAQIDMHLIRGNHDRHAGDPPRALELQMHDQFQLDIFCLRHEPAVIQDSSNSYVLAGHIHPTYVLQTARDRVRLPCYWFRQKCGVLPAFGAFTGGYNIAPTTNDQVILVASDKLLKVRAGKDLK